MTPARALAITCWFAATIATFAYAQWYDAKTGKPVPDTEWRKSVDGLGAALILTGDPEAFLKEWKESPESHMPTARPITEARRGDTVTALILFSGCGVGSGSCDVTVDFKVLNPDGSVYGDAPGSNAWSGQAPKAGIVVLSEAYLRIRIEPKDQLGEYAVIGVLQEKGTGKKISLQQRFQVLASPIDPNFPDKQSLGRWITYYYKNPEPLRVSQAYTAASGQGALRNKDTIPPFFGFLAGVLAKNPDLAASLIDDLSRLPSADGQVLVMGIWYSGLAESKTLLDSKAMPAHKPMIDYLVKNGPVAIDQIPLEQGPWVLDALWGYFMATGDDAPVNRIITALPWIEIHGDLPKLMVGGSARWSLISNAVQHPKVLQICREQVKLRPTEVARQLEAVIAAAQEELKKRESGAQ